MQTIIKAKSIKADVIKSRGANVLRLWIDKGGYAARKVVSIRITEEEKKQLVSQ